MLYNVRILPHHLTPSTFLTQIVSKIKFNSHFLLLHKHYILKNMKLIKINSKTFNPKRLFGSNRSKLSRSDPPSFASGSSNEPTTPTSVLPRPPTSGDWSDFSDDAKLLSRKGLEALLGLFGADPPSDDELKAVLGDGAATVETLVNRVGPAACDSELRDTFEIFDADRDGRITAEELLSVFTRIEERCTLEDCRRMIAGVDKNGDGFVCFEDFARMMDCPR